MKFKFKISPSDEAAESIVKVLPAAQLQHQSIAGMQEAYPQGNLLWKNRSGI